MYFFGTYLKTDLKGYIGVGKTILQYRNKANSRIYNEQKMEKH